MSIGRRGHAARTFADRREAGRALADALVAESPALAGTGDTVVLGLARGGVPVAREVADALGLPLDVLVVRKVGAPGRPEFAMGALCGGHVTVNGTVPDRLGVSAADFDAAVAREARVLAERERRYRAGCPPVSVAGATVILVDDGIATGTSMLAAARAVAANGAVSVVIGVPTAPADSLAALQRDADVVVSVAVPDPFTAVGLSYNDFHQVTDDEVIAALQR
ncbi:phosphoribosyltransferase [Gordonia sinesedis]